MDAGVQVGLCPGLCAGEHVHGGGDEWVFPATCVQGTTYVWVQRHTGVGVYMSMCRDVQVHVYIGGYAQK